jgi:hypothetical protein
VNGQSNAAKGAARRLWLWPIAILLGFPIGGLIADLTMDGVDSVGSALVEGLIAGVIVGAAEWFALRRLSRGCGSRRHAWEWRLA